MKDITSDTTLCTDKKPADHRKPLRMMQVDLSRLLIPSICLLFTSCSGQGAAEPALEGHWKFVVGTLVEDTPFLSQLPDPEIYPDERPLPQPPFTGPDLIFKKDTMYEWDYPEGIRERKRFSVEAGYLVARSFSHRTPCPLEFSNDTLYLYNPYWGRAYIKETYVKAPVNDSIVSIILQQGVDYPALAGTWMLVRYAGVGDGSAYELDFPFQLPDSLVLSREELIQMTHNNMVHWITTSGKKRDYLLSYSRSGYLELRPGTWYKGEDPWIHFTRK